MPGLNASLLTAMQALMAQQGALNVTTNNIANANTPGYTRERPLLVEGSPVYNGNVVVGTGVEFKGFESVRDELLNLRIDQETQQQAKSQAQLGALQQVEAQFSDSTVGIGADMSAFFDSLSRLSTDPADLSLRQSVISTGQNLANSFHQANSGLATLQHSLNADIAQSVQQINQLAGKIASLNTQVSQSEKLGQDPGALEDQRVQLIQQLSGLIDVSITTTEQGDTITTSGGVPLIVAGTPIPLETSMDATGAERVYSRGQDITSQIAGGQLSGDIQVRDQYVSAFTSQLDTLASQFTAAFNSVHQSGFDASGNPAGNFFTPLASVAGAAANFNVAITDPASVGASSDSSAGGNGNLTKLLAIRDQDLPSGQNPLEMYSNFVFQVGSASAQAEADVNASGLTLRQLNDQVSSVSGVSIDEETVNLIQYQHAFQAAARLISTVDQLTQTVLGMGSGA